MSLQTIVAFCLSFHLLHVTLQQLFSELANMDQMYALSWFMYLIQYL